MERQGPGALDLVRGPSAAGGRTVAAVSHGLGVPRLPDWSLVVRTVAR